MAKKMTSDTGFFEQVGNTFRLIGPSWRAMRLNLQTFILVAFLPAIILGLAAPYVVLPLFKHSTGPLISVLLVFLICFIALSFVCIFLPAMTVTQISSARGEKISLQEALIRGRAYFWRYPALIILLALFVIVGLILIIVPGLLVAYFLSMSTYIMVDKNYDVSATIKASYKLVKANWLIVLSVFVVNIVIMLISYFPYIGWLAGLILGIAYFCLPAIIYLKISQKTVKQQS